MYLSSEKFGNIMYILHALKPTVYVHVFVSFRSIIFQLYVLSLRFCTHGKTIKYSVGLHSCEFCFHPGVRQIRGMTVTCATCTKISTSSSLYTVW